MKDKVVRRTVMIAALAALACVPADAGASAPITLTAVDVSTTPAQPPAGGRSDLNLTLEFCGPALSCDSSQYQNYLGALDVSLPPGLTGNPYGLERCADSVFTTSPGSCPPGSAIGVVNAWISDGETPDGSSGPHTTNLYNLNPQGSEVGRFGSNFLGTTTVSTATVRTGSDYGIDVHTESTATGKISRLQITLWGQSVPFINNPTSCNPGTVTVTATAVGNSTPASGSDSYQAVNCAGLGFDPVTQVTAGGTGQNTRGTTPGMKMVVIRPNNGAATKSVKFLMPSQIRPTIAGIAAHTCRASLVASGCPGISPIGATTVRLPLLASPLSGPVYLVEVPGQLALDMTAKLSGQLSAQFSGRASFDGGGTEIADADKRSVVSVDNLPDLPIDRFELEIYGGRNGILAATDNLCNGVTLGSSYVGHNGKRAAYQENQVSIPGCNTAVTVASRTARVSGSGSVPIRLSCTSGGANCSGRLTLTSRKRPAAARDYVNVLPGSSKSVTVKLNKSMRKNLARKRKLSLDAAVTVGGGKQSSSRVTLKPQKKRAHRKHAKRR